MAAREAVGPTAHISGSAAGANLREVLRPICRLAVGVEAVGAEAQTAALLGVAQALANSWDLWIGGQPHCITELEVYVHGPAHQDPYTHGDEGQRCCGVWYFHRKGGSFKAGSFKGLDLACGDGAAGVSAGILLRSVRPLAAATNCPDSQVTEGPSVLVDRILKLNGKTSIADFVAGRSAAELCAGSTEGLCLRPAASPRSEQVWRAPRVGLVLRGGSVGMTHMQGGRPMDFVARFYRVSTAPRLLSKFRVGFAVAAYLQAGRAVAELATELSIPKMAEYAEAAEKGRATGSPAAFLDRQITRQPDLCELVGACYAAAHVGQ